MKVVNIRHVGLVVNDLDLCLSFYHDLLGFQVTSRQLERGSYISKMLGFSDTEVETVKMKPKQGDTLLELLCFKNPHVAKSETRNLNHSGFTHFAVSVSNLENLYKNLLKADIRFVNEPVVTENNYARVVFCRDPEGNYIELTEVLK